MFETIYPYLRVGGSLVDLAGLSKASALERILLLRSSMLNTPMDSSFKGATLCHEGKPKLGKGFMKEVPISKLNGIYRPLPEERTT